MNKTKTFALAVIAALSLATTSTAAVAAEWDLDPMFDGDGRVTASHEGNNCDYRYVAATADSKIVAAGVCVAPINPSPSGPSILLARYNADGTPDLTFNGSGSLLADESSLGCHVSFESSIFALQSDGKLLVTCSELRSAIEPGNHFVLLRYDVDGTPDRSFGVEGRVETVFPSPAGGPTISMADAVTVFSDGRILVGGYVRDSRATHFGFAAYQSDGSLDTSFGSEGLATYGNYPLPSYEMLNDLTIDQEGRIVFTGRHTATPYSLNGHDVFTYRNLVARLEASGVADSSFHPYEIGGVYFPRWQPSLLTQAGGKVIISAAQYNLSDGQNIVRLNTDGTLDSSWRFAGTMQYGQLAAQADGKILAAVASFDDRGWKIARLLPNGELDTSFGDSGYLSTTFMDPSGGLPDRGEAMIEHILVLPNQHIVAAGTFSYMEPTGWSEVATLARYGDLLTPRQRLQLRPTFSRPGLAPLRFTPQWLR